MVRNKEILEKLQAALELEKDFTALLGAKIVDGDIGYCKAEMDIQQIHMNPIGTVHGGCLYTLADTIGGYAAAVCGMPGPTLSGNMYFLNPTLGVKKLICEAKVVKNGKRIRVVDVVICAENGKEIARSLFEYMDVQKDLIKANHQDIK